MIEGRHFAYCQSQGARDYQEDDAGFYPLDGKNGAAGLLMVLADGMGGHRGGKHASRVAVETFINSFGSADGTIPERLERALHDANERIGEDSRSNPELEGMGCTLVGVALTPAGFEWISVGDSPMWLVRSGKLERLNEDHSMAPILAQQVELGEMTAEEAARHPQRNALRSAVIGDKMQHIDRSKKPGKFQRGDRLLLSSDGLETLNEDEIAGVFNRAPEADAEALAKLLVDEVDGRQRKGQDNITVMIIDPFVGGDDALGTVIDPEGATERIRKPDGTTKVTRRTITPKQSSSGKSGGLRAVLAIVVVLLIVAAAAAYLYRDWVMAQLGLNEPAALPAAATSAGSGGSGATGGAGTGGAGTGGGGTGGAAGGSASGGTSSGGATAPSPGGAGSTTPGSGATSPDNERPRDVHPGRSSTPRRRASERESRPRRSQSKPKLPPASGPSSGSGETGPARTPGTSAPSGTVPPTNATPMETTPAKPRSDATPGPGGTSAPDTQPTPGAAAPMQ
jgi:serine/threonine protein phosphatase PrpC